MIRKKILFFTINYWTKIIGNVTYRMMNVTTKM